MISAGVIFFLAGGGFILIAFALLFDVLTPPKLSKQDHSMYVVFAGGISGLCLMYSGVIFNDFSIKLSISNWDPLLAGVGISLMYLLGVTLLWAKLKAIHQRRASNASSRH